jgi:PqqD family protein of HPr-rel-A system
MGQVWQLISRSLLLWRAWDDEIVVYNVASGDTHHLDPLTSEAFDILLQSPADAAELAQRIATSLDVERSDELDNAVELIVRRFQGSGLVEPVLT